MNFEQLFVWIHLPGDLTPTLAGRAQRENITTGPLGKFVYAKRYLDLDRAVPIDPVTLPLEGREFEATLLSGHFSALLDAGPDLWGKRIIDLAHGAQTPYGYLLRTNGGQTGALSFSTSATIAPVEQTRFTPATALKALNLAARHLELGGKIDDAMAELLAAGSSAGGARPKFMVEHEGRLWLAKLESVNERDPHVNIPILEATALDLASDCGIQVPLFALHKIGRRRALLVERFDRIKQAAGWSRLRYVSARTVFYSNPEMQRYSHSGSYGRLAQELRRWSDAPREDQQQVFRRMAFNCLVSNTDDHELNHGLIADQRSFSLAPAFDIVPQPSGTRRRMQALIVGHDGALASIENILSVAPVFGLSRADAAALVEEMARTISAKWRSTLIHHGANSRMIHQLADRFTHLQQT